MKVTAQTRNLLETSRWLDYFRRWSVPAAKRKEEPIEDEESILRKMRRLTDYYDIHKEIGR